MCGTCRQAPSTWWRWSTCCTTCRRRDVVAEATRRAAPGGVFIYKDMTTRSRWRRFAHNLDDYLFTREWVEQVGDGAVEAWTSAGGLTLLHSEYLPRLVYGHELRVFQKPVKRA